MALPPLLTLGPAGPGSPLAPSRPLKPCRRKEKSGGEGVRGDPSARWSSPHSTKSCWRGGGTHPVTLHARQAGGSWQTTGTLGEEAGGDGGAQAGLSPHPTHFHPLGEGRKPLSWC